MTERPLHIRVALALGRCVDHQWEDLRPEKWAAQCQKCGRLEGMGPGQNAVILLDEIPRYDTDWAFGGPLIERFSFSVTRTAKAVTPPLPGDNWVAIGPVWGPSHAMADGRTPLEAVCLLILKLHERGALPKPDAP